jgi:flagellar secretion chaperone FliS
MNPRQAELSYRRAVVADASSVGLVITLYDLLVNDLTQALNALERGDIEARSTALKHAFLVLQQLQGSLNWEKGGEAARNLSQFYSFLRGRIWEAHVKKNREILREPIQLLLDVRQTWAQVDPANSKTAAIHPSDQPVRTPADDEKAAAGGWTA